MSSFHNFNRIRIISDKLAQLLGDYQSDSDNDDSDHKRKKSGDKATGEWFNNHKIEIQFLIEHIFSLFRLDTVYRCKLRPSILLEYCYKRSYMGNAH